MILDLLWWIGLLWGAAWAALPLVLLPLLGPIAGFAAWAVLAPWTALVGIAVPHRLLPASLPGVYRLPGDPGSLRWALKGWGPSVYLTLFQPLWFSSPAFQRLVLRAFGARMGRGAWVTSRTVVREPHRVRIGAGTLIGEYAHLACSFQPRPGVLVVGSIVIGEDSLVAAYTHIAPGARIGSRSVLEHAVGIGAQVTIGDDTRVGAATVIYSGAQIGRGVLIGKHCVIPSGAVVCDGARIPDGTILDARRAEPVAAS